MCGQRHDEDNKYFWRHIRKHLKLHYLGTISWWSQEFGSANVNIRDNLW
jgi:hypothetical protein